MEQLYLMKSIFSPSMPSWVWAWLCRPADTSHHLRKWRLCKRVSLLFYSQGILALPKWMNVWKSFTPPPHLRPISKQMLQIFGETLTFARFVTVSWSNIAKICWTAESMEQLIFFLKKSVFGPGWRHLVHFWVSWCCWHVWQAKLLQKVQQTTRWDTGDPQRCRRSNICTLFMNDPPPWKFSKKSLSARPK